MRRMPYDLQVTTGFPSETNCKKKEGIFAISNEPISVLDTRRSPSPSTSTSTLSSSFNGGSSTENTTGNPAGISDNKNPHQKWPSSIPQEMGISISGSVTVPAGGGSCGRKDEWAADLQLQPIPAGFEGINGSSQRFGVGLDDWESLLSESGQEQDQSLLRWISGDVEDSSFSLKQLLQGQIDENAPAVTIFETSEGNNVVLPSMNNNNHPSSFPGLAQNPNFNPQQSPNLFGLPEQKPQILNPIPQLILNNPPVQVPQMFAPLLSDQFQHQPQPKRHNPGHPKAPYSDPGQQLPQMGLANNVQQKQQIICDQLFSAAELILAGNFSHAQGILARLNHQLFSPMNANNAIVNKPFQRAAFYFKEALQMGFLMCNPLTSLLPRIPTPVNGMFKMGAYKVLSEVSPLIQFMNFTSNQTLLEALEDVEHIHIIDFDIGFGAQWASFIQELPRRGNSGSFSLKITAFASPSTHHPVELGLMHENLSQFAHDVGISFELEVVNLDSFDPSSFLISGNETIAVNFPIWSVSTHLSAIPSLLHFIKQLSPRIVVSLDRGCERTDLPSPQYLLHGLQYYEVLLDSIDAANVTLDTVNKVERFLFQPRIENMVLGRIQFPEQMPHWKTLFSSGGYSPVVLSNFAEAQAECVVKRAQIRGFHVEKRQGSLVLCWQHRELMSVSAWKC